MQLVLASIVFFFVGSVVSALAENFTMMLVGRSIQGIGGGGIMSLGEILVTDLVPLAVRGGMHTSHVSFLSLILTVISLVRVSWFHVGDR